MAENEEFLGDGLYASFDGWHIKLRAPRLMSGTQFDANGVVEHEVYLELGFGGTLGHFLGYVDRCLNLADARKTTAEKAQSRMLDEKIGGGDRD